MTPAPEVRSFMSAVETLLAADLEAVNESLDGMYAPDRRRALRKIAAARERLTGIEEPYVRDPFTDEEKALIAASLDDAQFESSAA
jgi:hypothetical protein